MAKTIPPSEGERAAQAGYTAQYKIAANLIYNSLLNGSLEFIRVVDPEAGRVDDIQIASPGRLDAYQVKWAQTAKYFTFNELVKDTPRRGRSAPKPNLIQQLAEGWKRLSTKYSERHVFVHLISRNIPSPIKKIPIDDTQVNKQSFQGFIRDCWCDRSWAKVDYSAIPKGWVSAVSKILTASRLDKEDFLRFVQVCELEFEYKLSSPDIYPGREGLRHEKDVNQIAALLASLAGSDPHIIELSRTDLLTLLSWESRFTTRFVHEFPVDNLYQPIKSTVTELEKSLSRFNSGYLSLIGTPGSGKSTTLTKSLRYRPGCRVIRYYAFVPENPAQGRGEASNFLHDLHLELKSLGIYGKKGSHPVSREEYIERFGDQIAELGEKWQEEHVPTLILVDGLDHIEREQSPQRSLIEDLPLPNTIPEGIIFILGTQTLHLRGLSPAIKAQLKENDRTLTMQPLERESVHTLLDSANMQMKLSFEQKGKAFIICNGHPLALIYLLEELRGATNTNEINEIFERTDPYQGHIDKNYEVFWQNLNGDDIRKLLGLIARVRIPFNPKELVKWSNETTVTEFIKKTSQYFNKETPSQWSFFHNSFRQFLLIKTKQDILENDDPQKHHKYHNRLAEFAAAAEPDSPWSWEELYHRACAEDWASVLRLGTQKVFRDQFFNFRSLSTIIGDINLVLQAAQKANDGLAIIRCFLIEHELSERQYNLDQINLPDLLLTLKSPELVTDYMLEGHTLHTNSIQALELCVQLVKLGKRELAQKIFNAAEPLDILKGIRVVTSRGHDDIELLKAWARVVYHFRSFENIFTIIEQLRGKEETPLHGAEPIDVTDHIKKEVILQLINAISKDEDKNKIIELKKHLSQQKDADKFQLHLDFALCNHDCTSSEANEALDRIISIKEQDIYDDYERVLIAEFIYRIKMDKVNVLKWLKNIPQPDNYTWGLGQWENLSPFIPRIRLNRLLAALGKPVDPIYIVQDGFDPRERGNILFERNIILVSNIWGFGWSKKYISPTEVVRELYPSLIMFHHDFHETNDWSGWYQIKNAAPDFFSFVIHSAATHGDEAIQALSKAFEELWNNDNTLGYWPIHLRIHIAFELYRNGDKQLNVLISRLERMEAQIGVWNNVHERINAYSDIIKGWQRINEKQRANSLLIKLMEDSFGIYHDKDYQYLRWVGWLAKITKAFPSSTVEDIRRFSGTLVVLQGSSRGRGTQDAACDLISLIAKWHPEYALELCNWLLDNHAVYFIKTIEGLLDATLDSSDPPIEVASIIARYLLIPFECEAPVDLIKNLAIKCHRVFEKGKASSLLRELAVAIETKSFPVNRHSYWQAIIEGLRSLGIEDSDFLQRLATTPRKEDSTIQNNVTLISGKILTEDEAIMSVHNKEELINFIQKVEKTDFFHWELLIEPFVNIFSYDDIQVINEALAKHNSKSIVLSMLSRQLANIGFPEEACTILKTVLLESSPRGWNPRYDGGTRLKAVQNLVAINPTDWRPKAIDLFVHDYIAESRYPSNMLENLEDIIPVLFNEPPLMELWQEITEHIYHLCDFSKVVDLPPSPSSNEEASSCSEMLVKFVIKAVEIPVPEIREATHRILFHLIMTKNNDELIEKYLHEFLSDKGFHSIHGLAILEVLMNTRPEFVMRLSEQIKVCCSSPDFCVRRVAEGLAQQLAIEPNPVPYNRSELPPIYRFRLPNLVSREELIPIEALPPGTPFPDISDPLEMIRPFDNIISLLSELSGIPEENLLYRASFLMGELSPKTTWNKDAEKQLQYWLDSADLKITFQRLRPKMALRAISHIVAELVDVKVLDVEVISLIMGMLTFHDRFLSIRDPVKRPLEIKVPELGYIDRPPYSEWLKNRSEALPLLISDYNSDCIILGELTHFRGLDWETPSEHRMSMVCHPQWPEFEEVKNASGFFPYNSLWYAQDYPSIREMPIVPSTVIYGHPLLLELGSTYWLALHPAIARTLGWHFASDGLFKWVDTEGITMVESLWWRDGPLDRTPPRISEVCGEGWLVIASKEAVNSFLNSIGDVVKISVVVREFQDKEKNQRLYKSAIKKSPWIPS